MTRPEILARIRQLTVEHQEASPGCNRIPADQITEATSFVDGLGFDSLDSIELHMAVECAFDVEVLDDHAEEFKTVGGIVDFMERRLLTVAA